MSTKKLMHLTAVFLMAASLELGGAVLHPAPAIALPSQHLDWGHQLHATDTSCPPGKTVLNVMYKIINSLDSGTGLNDFSTVWWAVIDYVLQVQVVELDDGVFCATVKNQGSFVSVGGDGPGCSEEGTCGDPEGRLEAGVMGTFEGGFTQTFEGTFNPGDMRTKGSIGEFDQACDPLVADSTVACSGAGVTRWLSLYFTGVSGFNFDEWWGWVYHAGNNGSWVNKIDGNSGNITGE